MHNLNPRRRPHFGIVLLSSLSSFVPVACLLCVVAGIVSGALKKALRIGRSRKSPGRFHIFKHRWPLWLMQCSATLLSISLLASTDDVYSIHIVTPLSLLVALFFDRSKTFRLSLHYYPWFLLYLMVFLSCLHRMFLDGSKWLSIGNCLLSMLIILAWYLRSQGKYFEETLSNPLTSEYTSNILSYVSFSYLNSTIFATAIKNGALEASEVPELSDFDSTEYLWRQYQKHRRAEVSLFWNVLRVVRREWCMQGLFAVCGALGEFISPVALSGVLWHLSHEDGAEGTPPLVPLSLSVAVAMVGAGPFIAAFFDNINYAHGRHVGIQVRALLQCCIYGKLLRLDPGGIEDGAGRVNNLVSTDCTNCLQFWSYSHGIWTGILQIAVCVTLLYVTLGIAAFGGLAVMLVAMPIGAWFSDR